MGLNKTLLAQLLAGAGVAPSLVITQAAPFFFDTADNTDTSMTGRTGWNAVGDATKSAKMKSADGMFRMKTHGNGGSPFGHQITNAPAQNRRITFEYDYSQQGGTLSDTASPLQFNDQKWILAWSDISNYTHASPSVMAAGFMQVRVYKVVAGVTTEMFRYYNIPTTGTLTFESSDRLRMLYNGVVRIPEMTHANVDNAYPDKKYPAGTDAIRTGGSGFQHSFYPLTLGLSWKVEELDEIRVDDPKQFYGHDENNQRLISFSGTYSGTPTSWAYRLRRRSTLVTTKDWTAITPTAAAGVWSADITIDAGGPYLLDVGWTGGDGFTRIATSNCFAVGKLIGCWGQSNATNQNNVGGSPGYGGNDLIIGFNNYLAYAGTPVRRYMDELTTESRGYQPSMVGLAKSLSDALDMPVGVFAVGVGAQAIDTLLPGTTHWNNWLVPLVAEVGGNVHHWVWSQGEAEVLSLSPYITYPGMFSTLIAGLRSLGGVSSAMIFLRSIGKDLNITNDATRTTRAQEARSVMSALENGTDVWMACSSLGVAMSDPIHFSSVGGIDWSRRVGLTVARRAYGAIGYDGRGPLVTSASRSGAVITCAIDLNGATGITGSALSGYAVSNDDFSTVLSISSVEVVSNQIVITLTGTPTGTVKVRSFREQKYDDSSLAVGTYAVGINIPVFPIIDAITVS